MDKSTANNPTLGTWTNLPTEPTELKPSIKFEVNIPVEVPAETPIDIPADIPLDIPPEVIIPRAPIVRIPPIIPPGLGSMEEVTLLKKKDLTGAVAWKQGMFWITAYSPYTRDSVVYSRAAPVGVKRVSGLGSAYRTLSRLNGGNVKGFTLDIGAFLATVSPEAKSIRFREDR